MTTTTCSEATTQAWGDNQYQSDAPIGEQAPIPGGIFAMRLSWDRTASYFRLEIPSISQVWHFKKLLGQVQVIGTEPSGRMNLWGMARSDGETLTLYRDPDAKPHPTVEGGLELPATNNRLCYNRQELNWRLRDQRLTDRIYQAYLEQTKSSQRSMALAMQDKRTLRLVKSYVGDWACSKPYADRAAHVFHGPDGWVVIDEDNVAHLYDPDLVYD
jgi:hypothetical protein